MGIVLGKKEYLKGFYLQDSGNQLWWPLVDVRVDSEVYCWYGIIEHFVKRVGWPSFDVLLRIPRKVVE